MGDEHGLLSLVSSDSASVTTGSQQLPGHGDVVTFTTPHCDPTVNLYDQYHVVGGENDHTLVAIWQIQARGRCQ
jgi:3-hydroxy-D-aspartate aldolase